MSKVEKIVKAAKKFVEKKTPKPKPPKTSSAKGFLKSRQSKRDALTLAAGTAIGLPATGMMSLSVRDMARRERKAKEKEAERKREEAKKKELEKKKPEKKAGGGMMKKKSYAKGGAVRKQSKPRGVGAATRGYGRAMK